MRRHDTRVALSLVAAVPAWAAAQDESSSARTEREPAIAAALALLDAHSYHHT